MPSSAKREEKKNSKFDLEDLEKTEKYLGKKLNVQAVKCTNSLGWVESKRGGISRSITKPKNGFSVQGRPILKCKPAKIFILNA